MNPALFAERFASPPPGVTGAGAITLTADASIADASTTAITAGNLASTANGGSIISGVISGAGKLTFGAGAIGNGGVNLRLTANNTYAGGTVITANSAIAVTNTGSIVTGAAGVTIAANAGLLLNGKLVLSSNTATIANSGVVDGTTGTIDLNGQFDTFNGGSSGTYQLITGSGTTAGSFSVSGYNTSVFSSVTYNAGNLNFIAVPKPSTYGLIGAGALAGIAHVRRRRKVCAV